MEPKMESISMKRLVIENSFPTDKIYPGTLRKGDGRFITDFEQIEEGCTLWDAETETRYVLKNDKWVKISDS